MEELLVHCSGCTGWTLRKVGLWDTHKINATELYGTPICHYTVEPAPAVKEDGERTERGFQGLSWAG